MEIFFGVAGRGPVSHGLLQARAVGAFNLALSTWPFH
jgi:hypothetical protein